jgi:DNA polymerase-3 subunit gamma/tau
MPERSYRRPSQRAAAAAEPPREERAVPPAAPAPEPVAARGEPAAEEPAAEEPPGIGGIDATGVRRVWPELLASIRKTSRSTEAMLTNATVQSVEGTSVVLAHTAEPLARRLSEPRNADFIAAALRDVLGGSWQVRCVHGGGSASPARSAASSRAQAGPPAPARQPAPSQPSRPARPQATAPEPSQRSYQRPSAGQPDTPARPVAPPEPDIPLPPEPEDEDIYSEDASPPPPPAAVPDGDDPEAAAHKLLSEQLGARPIE